MIEILRVSRSEVDGETTIIELKAECGEIIYTRRMTLEEALEEYGRREIEDKLAEYLQKRLRRPAKSAGEAAE
ncbi:MAG: hypothetical protein QXE23_08685 [Nitrososphaerota archaeon]